MVISSGTIIRTILILVVAYLIYRLLDLVLVVLTATVIASAVEPIIKWCAKFKIKRIFAVIMTYVFVGSVMTSLLIFFVPPVLNDATALLNSSPKYLETLTLWNPLNQVDSGPVQALSGTAVSGISEVVNQFKDITSNISDRFVTVITNIFGGVLSFVLIIVLSFYLAVQEKGVENFLRIITPMRHEAYVVDLWYRSQKKIGYWMQGQLLLGLLVGILVYLGLTILGVQNALILAVFAGVFEIIPIFGPIIAAIPAILFGVVDGGFTTGILVLGLFVIIQQFENHLIYPLVVKKMVGVSPILVILALIVGAKLAGFLGIILSAPLTSILMEFIDDMQKDKLAHLIDHA